MDNNTPHSQPYIYLAGYEVFLLNAVETGQQMKQLCSKYGFNGLFPLDKEITPTPDRQTMAAAIFEGNIRLINKADLIIANLNPFRGTEPDPGTIFECGYAYATGKKIYGFLSDGRSSREKLLENPHQEDAVYKDGMRVEDFNMPINLMIGVPATVITGSFEDCLRKVSQDWNAMQ